MKLVSVVIVNWGCKDFLALCFNSLRAQSFSPLEVIVVDNQATDKSQQLIKENYPAAKIITNPTNDYFCKSQNQGIKKAAGEFILCLNNDCWLRETYIEQLMEALQRDDKIGLATGKILLRDTGAIDSCGQFLGKCRKPVDRGYREKDRGQYQKAEYIFGASGAAPLLSRKMLEEIKIGEEYFDEAYQIWYEDLDLCWRANQFGWKGFYVPTALAYHARGGTSITGKTGNKYFAEYDFVHLPPLMKMYLVRNRYLTIIKNDSWKGLLANLIHILFYDLKLWGYLLFFCPNLVLPIIFDLINSFQPAWEKRQIIRQKIKQKSLEIKAVEPE